MSIEKVKKSTELIETVERFLQTGYEANHQFNEAIDGEEPLIVRSIKEPDNEYRYDASEILYWVDRNAYWDEFDSWNGEQIKDKYSACINFIQDTDQSAVFLDLVALIRKKKIAPFLGAGVSRAAGYPIWGEALQSLSKKIASFDATAFQELLQDNKYLEAAQTIADASQVQLNNYVQTTFRTKFENEEDREQIPRIFKHLYRLANGCIITTNFDPLIEETFKLKGAPLTDAYMYGLQAGNNFVQRLLKGDRCILKLHGDASQSSSYVFTAEQYQNAYGDPIDFSKQLPRALRQIYISNSLLFLGCSLNQDKTLELFQQVKTSAEFDIPEHFAFLPETSNPSERQATEERLLILNIRPIWYSSENYHEMLPLLIELAIDISEHRLNLK
ncbi:SIR2 family protein [Undibacterium amnicola]|uniref:SIR2 family protein n=1 Tax=Undibacterium amnicola TaxID=1834038 RepID=A0ABR6XQF1_9BURK|nr:SIR2 family protein [Undibacterium amnicola]MBC3831731.1 SIR2 family protein [Undibacterium amnicola]